MNLYPWIFIILIGVVIKIISIILENEPYDKDTHIIENIKGLLFLASLLIISTNVFTFKYKYSELILIACILTELFYLYREYELGLYSFTFNLSVISIFFTCLAFITNALWINFCIFLFLISELYYLVKSYKNLKISSGPDFRSRMLNLSIQGFIKLIIYVIFAIILFVF